MPKSVFSPAYGAILETLIAARKEAGVTQVELARRLGKRQQFVSYMESGVRRVDLIEFCAVAKALGREPSDLIDQVLRQLPDQLSI